MGLLLYRVTGKEVDKSLSILSNHPLTEDRPQAHERRRSSAERPAAVERAGMDLAEGDLQFEKLGLEPLNSEWSADIRFGGHFGLKSHHRTSEKCQHRKYISPDGLDRVQAISNSSSA